LSVLSDGEAIFDGVRRSGAASDSHEPSKGSDSIGGSVEDCSLIDIHAFFEEFDEALLFGDEGVDAGGFGVQVVRNRPLLFEWWNGDLQLCENLGTDALMASGNRLHSGIQDLASRFRQQEVFQESPIRPV
jgi:hypothetical protein